MRKRNNYNNQNQNSGGKGRYRKPQHQGGHNRNHSNRPQDAGRRKKAVANSREKYLNMARDALHAGDRITAENYFQHADHYQRLLDSLSGDAGEDKNRDDKRQDAEENTSEDTTPDASDDDVASAANS